MFTIDNKRDVLKLLYWLSLTILLGVLTTIKLALWSGKPIFDKLLVSTFTLGLIFFLIALMKKT
jgi:hypothetical protein